MDLIHRLTATFERMFQRTDRQPYLPAPASTPAAEIEDVIELPDGTPEHLRPLPDAPVHELCDRIGEEINGLIAYGIRLELMAFRESRTPHDGHRLERALRHVLNRGDLADEVEALIEENGK